MKRTFITFTYGYQNNELTKILKKSINDFSEYDLKVYTPKDFNFSYEYENQNFWKSGNGFIMKIHSCLKSLEDFDEVVWLDTDIVVNEKIDKIWNSINSVEGYPLLPKSRFSNYVSNPTGLDSSLLIKHIKNIQEYFKIKDKEPENCQYLQACAMIFDRGCIKYFENVINYFDNFDSKFLPNGDESIMNGLNWKFGFDKNLGNIFLCSHYYHGNLKNYITLENKEDYPKLFKHEIKENNYDEVLFFHGTKSLTVAEMLLSLLRKHKKEKKLSLGEIMKKNGSDKSTKHNYTELYSMLFDKFKKTKVTIFELGIGTNDESIPWNMTKNGKPGASLISWLEFFDNCEIYAADIDESILINNDKIKSFYCNQLDKNSIQELWSNDILQEIEFDIMILDGCHTYDANIFFFENSFHKIKSGGFCIVEDISKNEISSYKQKMNDFKYWYPTSEFTLIEVFQSEKNISDNSVFIFKKN